MVSQPAVTKSGSGDESGKLIIRACDMCRKKKIRCEWTETSCVQCIKYKTHCHFTPINTKRRPRGPQRQKYLEEMEKRLKRMESLLRNQGGISTISRKSEIPRRSNDREVEFKLGESEQSFEETDEIQPLDFRRTEVPSGSTFNLNESPSKNQTIYTGASEHYWQVRVPDWKNTTLFEVFARRIFKPLPPKHEALLLIHEAFQSFNTTFPIFDQASFMATFGKKYYDSDSDREDPGWWACLNFVLALAHRFRSMRTLDSQPEDREAWGYMQNALAVATELTMLHSQLSAVQALLGMAIILQGTPNPQPCSVLISSALRLAQSMGLHRRNQDPCLSRAEIEQRKRVFWITYFMDKDVTLRTGQPPAQDDDEIDVDLPAETVDLETSGSEVVNFFNLRIGLAIIQGQIYKRLCSVRASRQSEVERMIAVKELDAMLEAWRRSVPIDFMGGYFPSNIDTTNLSSVLHTIITRFTYFNSLSTIHRSSLPNSEWHVENAYLTSNIREPGISDNILCVAEARESVNLLRIIPQGDYACMWLLLHVFVSASTIILSHIISNPDHPFVSSDLQVTESLIKLLRTLTNDKRNLEVERMYEALESLDRDAREVVQGLRGRSDNRKKEEQKESVEEFIRRIEYISAS